LDQLRSARKPLPVDLFSEQPFPSMINPREYPLISMQFVADGITHNRSEYFACLRRVTDMVCHNGVLLMAAIVNSKGWSVGPAKKPSPNVSEAAIRDALRKAGFSLIYQGSSKPRAALSYSGYWVVIAAAKTTTANSASHA
jgi:hypothetical protein